MGEGSGSAAGDDVLWALIDRTRPISGDPRAHATALTDALVEVGVDGTLAAARTFDRALADLHTWELWAVLFTILLGCSDDTFEYAKAWIVGQGRDAVDLAIRDPQAWGIAVLEGTDHDESAVAERIEDRWIFDGEPLLGAVGDAHRRLTGQPLPRFEPLPSEPAGEPFDEDDLGARVPRLLAALPEDWLDVDTEPVSWPPTMTMAGPNGPVSFEVDVMLDTRTRVERAARAHEAGDHAAVLGLLAPIADDDARWELVAASGVLPSDVAYVAGVARMFAGDLDGAARVLRRVVSPNGYDDRVRRALAQVEMALGELDAAEALLDCTDRAGLMDQALAVNLRWRQGSLEAYDRAVAIIAAKPRKQERGQHPWTVAGALVQAALVAAEMGALDLLDVGIGRIDHLTRGGPADLPVRVQLPILVASRQRQRFNVELAERVLIDAVPRAGEGTCDRGLLELELARCERARGQTERSQAAYGVAIATLDAAGERWHAARARAERG